MMAITTNNSTSVNPTRAVRNDRFVRDILFFVAFQTSPSSQAQRITLAIATYSLFGNGPEMRSARIRKLTLGADTIVLFRKSATSMTASTQEGTYHPICGRSSDSLLFQSLLTFSSTKRTMVHESSDRRNIQLQSSIQRPDRLGISPKFPVHPSSQQQTGSPQTARNSNLHRAPVNSIRKRGMNKPRRFAIATEQ
jgi:hypothetical protein